MRRADISQAAYLDMKAQGKKEKEIADSFGVSQATLYNHKAKWKVKQSDTEAGKTIETKTLPNDKTAELRKMVNELRNELNEARKQNAELEKKVGELETLHAACDDIESELEGVKKLRDTYHEQLLDTRDKLIRKDYELENNKRANESINKVLKRLTKENQVLKDLAKANAMAQLEFL